MALVAIQPQAKVPTLNNTKQLNNTKPVAKVELVAPPTPTPPPVVPAPVAPVAPPAPTTHEGLMAAAGISPSDYAAVDYIVSHESSWNQDATEPTSGAHGLVQALPFSKTGCGWEDAVCTLRWGQQYALQRYGGWWAAMNYWQVHRNW